MVNKPIAPTRDELSRITTDPRALRNIEKLFKQSNDNLNAIEELEAFIFFMGCC